MRPLTEVIEEHLISHNAIFEKRTKFVPGAERDIFLMALGLGGLPWVIAIFGDEEDRYIHCQSYLPVGCSSELVAQVALMVCEQNHEQVGSNLGLNPDSGCLSFSTTMLNMHCDPEDCLLEGLIVPHMKVPGFVEQIHQKLDGDLTINPPVIGAAIALFERHGVEPLIHEELKEQLTLALEKLATGEEAAEDGADFVGGSQMVH